MKSISTLFVLALIFSSCNVKNLNRKFTETSKNDSKGLAVQVPLEESKVEGVLELEKEEESEFKQEPIIVQDFFKISEDLFDKKSFHYDKSALKKLVKSDNLSMKKGWANYIVSADGTYLLFENIKKFALIEFKVIERDGKRQAFLNQVNEEDQLFSFLEYNQETNDWEAKNSVPMPKKEDYFLEKDDTDLETINEFGVAYAYLSADSDDICFAFLDKETKKKSNGKYSREADFKFALAWDNEQFWLERKPIRK